MTALKARGQGGYGRPPEAHRFKAGQSGNPEGRPKDVKNEATILRALLNRKIQVRQGGRSLSVSVLEAMLLKFAEEALKGDTKAAAFLLNRYGPDESTGGDPAQIDGDDEKILEAFARKLEARMGDEKNKQ